MEFPLIESLAIKEGVILNTKWHEERYTKTYKEYYGCKPEFGLLQKLELQIPEEGYYKLRIAYNKLTKDINISTYVTPPIKTLKVTDTKQLDYHLKYANRETIKQLFAMRGECDDILILNDGMVSDTSIANILFLKNGKWLTPNTPLLKGTQRAKLLSEGMITERKISKGDITTFEAFQIINAMRPFDRKEKIPIGQIFF